MKILSGGGGAIKSIQQGVAIASGAAGTNSIAIPISGVNPDKATLRTWVGGQQTAVEVRSEYNLTDTTLTLRYYIETTYGRLCADVVDFDSTRTAGQAQFGHGKIHWELIEYA